MRALDKLESSFRFARGVIVEPSVKEQRLGHKEHKGEDHPDQHHRVQPPEFWISEAVPGCETMDHVETGRSHKQR